MRSLLRPPMVGRLALFVGIWFVYYIGNYGWLTLAPTLFTDKGYSLADSTTYLIVSGIGFLVGAYATTHFTDRLERKYTTAAIAVAWGISLLVIGYFVSPAIIIVFGFIASLTIGLLVPMLYTYTAEHFSTNARATGVALTDGLGHIGGALAPLIVLGANSAWGFSSAFLVMAISGLRGRSADPVRDHGHQSFAGDGHRELSHGTGAADAVRTTTDTEPVIAFEFGSNVYRLTDEQATLVAQNLRNYAKGTCPRDVALGSRMSGNPDWTDGALALAEFTEEALVGNLDGPLPLEGKAAESMFWTLRMMRDLGESAGAALRDALGARFVASG